MNNAQREKKIRAACRKAKRAGIKLGFAGECGLSVFETGKWCRDMVDIAKEELQADRDWAWSFMSGFDGIDWVSMIRINNKPSAYAMGVRIRKEFFR